MQAIFELILPCIWRIASRGPRLARALDAIETSPGPARGPRLARAFDIIVQENRHKKSPGLSTGGGGGADPD
jgi:hypothetical protein